MITVVRSGRPLGERAHGPLLLLGEAPTEDAQVPLRTPWARARICRALWWEGWPDEHADCANLLDEVQPQSPSGKGTTLDDAAARCAVRDSVELLGKYQRIVVLGTRAWRAIADVLDGIGPSNRILSRAAWGSDDDATHLLLYPHPSGTSRWWNDAQNVARARAALRSFVEVEEVKRA